METKTFSVVTSISMVLALTVAVLSIIGVCNHRSLSGDYCVIVSGADSNCF
jgi:hypothetical protein